MAEAAPPVPPEARIVVSVNLEGPPVMPAVPSCDMQATIRYSLRPTEGVIAGGFAFAPLPLEVVASIFVASGEVNATAEYCCEAVQVISGAGVAADGAGVKLPPRVTVDEQRPAVVASRIVGLCQARPARGCRADLPQTRKSKRLKRGEA